MVADGPGWITEFEKTQQALIDKYGVSKIDKFYDWNKIVGGRFNEYLDNIKMGFYSDDTQLLLSVARSINDKGDIDNVYFREGYRMGKATY